MNNDYEQYRIKLLCELRKSGFETDSIHEILKKMDKISDEFSIQYTGKALSLVSGSWQRCLEAYVCSRAVEGVSKNTLKSRCYVIRNFFEKIGKDIDKVNSMDVRNWLYTKNVKDVTKESYRTNINAFFNWCVSEEMIEKNPAARIPVIKCECKLKDHFNSMEVEMIRNVIKKVRDSAVFEFLLSTGCRVSEMIGVKKTDIGTDGSIKVYGKGRKERLVWLTAKATIALRNYLETRRDSSPYLFVAERGYARAMSKETVELLLRNIEKNLKEKIGKKLTPHSLRRTMATLALEHGAPMHSISKLLGHANIAVTERYAQINDKMLHDAHVQYVV